MSFQTTVWLALLLAALGSSTAAWSCEKGDPRCAMSRDLMRAIAQEERVLAAQRRCREGARANQPEELRRREPGRLMGLQEGTPAWFELTRAYTMYVDEACGESEVVALVMEGYRIVYDRLLPGDALREALQKPDSIDEKVKAQANEQVHAVMSPILNAMALMAENNYMARITAVVSGKAVSVADESACEPGQAAIGPRAAQGGLPRLGDAEPSLRWRAEERREDSVHGRARGSSQ